MMLNKTFAGILALLAMLITGPLLAADPVVSEYVVEGEYDDVRFDLSDAIIARGLTVDHVSHISDMLKRTAGVVEGARPIYKRGEHFQFCSAVLSRHSMQADPANIAFCPYMVYIYESVDKPGIIHLGFRRLTARGNEQSRKALMAVNDLLQGIITEASGN
jgi:hypothetical protein